MSYKRKMSIKKLKQEERKIKKKNKMSEIQ